MEALLDADGYVAKAHVMSPIPEFDLAALTAVKAWVFTPPTQANGDHVAMIITVTVNFRLR
jgi:TonB family protein